MDRRGQRQQGFGLIEVTVALVLIAVTAGSLLQLSKHYLNYARESVGREMALRLLESKLDTFKNSRTLNEYQAISSGSEQQVLAEYTFNLSWEVSEWSWDKDSEQWYAGAEDPAVSKKDIQLFIAWQDGHAEPQQLFMKTSVTFITPLIAGPFGWPAVHGLTPSLAPKVSYSSSEEAGVVPFLLATGEYKESRLPEITLDVDNIPQRVTMDSVVYSSAKHKRQQQAFITQACDCQLASPTLAKLPAQVEVSQELSYWRAGAKVIKSSGHALAGQPAVCSTCCTDHFDGPAAHFNHWHNAEQWQQTQTAHRHFDSAQQPVSQPGETYKEACRLIRRAGVFEVASDWQLIGLTIMSPDFLEQHLAAYQIYMEQLVVAQLQEQISAGSHYHRDSEPLSFVDYLSTLGIVSELVLTTTSTQPLVARGVYVDLLSPEWRQYLATTVLNNTPTAPLTPTQRAQLFTLAPMTEVDLTALVAWHSQAPDIVDFSAPALLTAHLSGLAEVSALIRRSNSGLVGKALGAADAANTLSAKLAVRVE